MINNSEKKALSTVVTTLIIILLVFVAIGIVWVVVRNVVEGGANQIDVGAKCIASSVKATSVDCTNPAACSVTLKRDLGDDEIGGVKLVFTNTSSTTGDTTPNPIDISASTYPRLNSALSSVTVNNIDSGVSSGPDKVEVTVYLKDSNGEQKLCGTTNPYSF